MSVAGEEAAHCGRVAAAGEGENDEGRGEGGGGGGASGSSFTPMKGVWGRGYCTVLVCAVGGLGGWR